MSMSWQGCTLSHPQALGASYLYVSAVQAGSTSRYLALSFSSDHSVIWLLVIYGSAFFIWRCEQSGGSVVSS